MDKNNKRKIDKSTPRKGKGKPVKTKCTQFGTKSPGKTGNVIVSEYHSDGVATVIVHKYGQPKKQAYVAPFERRVLENQEYAQSLRIQRICNKRASDNAEVPMSSGSSVGYFKVFVIALDDVDSVRDGINKACAAGRAIQVELNAMGKNTDYFQYPTSFMYDGDNTVLRQVDGEFSMGRPLIKVLLKADVMDIIKASYPSDTNENNSETVANWCSIHYFGDESEETKAFIRDNH